MTVFAAPDLTGATRLSSIAALRIGAGLVTIQCDKRGDVYRASLPPEIMVQDQGEPVPEKTTALLAGPGGILERHRETLYARKDLPRIIDSAAFPKTASDLNGNGQTILTPHEGEFSKLFGPIEGDRHVAAQKAATESASIVVLKGAQTLIAHPDGRIVINDRLNPDLATAGTGDVLAGMIAGLVAQGMVSFAAACAGVWLHSEAGERIGAGLIASDIIAEVPDLVKCLETPRR